MANAVWDVIEQKAHTNFKKDVKMSNSIKIEVIPDSKVVEGEVRATDADGVFIEREKCFFFSKEDFMIPLDNPLTIESLEEAIKLAKEMEETHKDGIVYISNFGAGYCCGCEPF